MYLHWFQSLDWLAVRPLWRKGGILNSILMPIEADNFVTLSLTDKGEKKGDCSYIG